MSIEKWMHRIGIRMTAPCDNASAPRRFSPLGNGIDPEWRSGWTHGDSGFYDTRRHSTPGSKSLTGSATKSCGRSASDTGKGTRSSGQNGNQKKGRKRERPPDRAGTKRKAIAWPYQNKGTSLYAFLWIFFWVAAHSFWLYRTVPAKDETA